MMGKAAQTLTTRFEAKSVSGWLYTWVKVIAEFGTIQLLVQALTTLAGLIIVRTMSKQEYALFAIANSMQVTCNLLADLGIGFGVRSIGGRVWQDRYRFGQLLNTALELRCKFGIVSLVVCIPVAGWMLWSNGAEPLQNLSLCAAIAAGVIPLLGSSVWNVSPLLHREYRRIQKIDLGNAVLRIALIGVLALQRINAILTVLVGVAGNWIQSVYLRRWARDRAEPGAPVNEQDRDELMRVSLNSLPNAVFFCFQGQVTLLILTFMGNPTGIADVTALGRIAALFTVFTLVFTNVLAPRFACCQDPERLPYLYLLFLGATVLILLPLSLFAWFFPDPFLWLLGEKYQHLGSACGWVVVTGGVSQVAGVMWGLNSSRAWIRLQAPAFIPTIILAQAASAFFLDLSQFHDVLILNLIVVASPIPVYAVDAYFGCRAQRLDPALVRYG